MTQIVDQRYAVVKQRRTDEATDNVRTKLGEVHGGARANELISIAISDPAPARATPRPVFQARRPSR